MQMLSNVKVVAFDADDTLWDCQTHFERVTDECCELLAPWADAETVRRRLFETEQRNMELLGYGTKAFTLSLIENAIAVSGGQLTGKTVGKLLQLGHRLLLMPARPLPEVAETLEKLYEAGRYRLVVFTKGELLDQEAKLRRSGLGKYFQHVEIVSDKTRQAFLTLCRNLRIAPASLLMVGNSLRSDIAPALEIGARAVYIPFHVTWAMEHAEEFSHERMMRIEHFNEILNLL